MVGTNIIQYELFASVARTNNISKTAAEFDLTQPAVSHHIIMLEEALGVKLLNRTNRGATLTEAGEEYLSYVENILSVSTEAEARMKSIAEGTASKVTVAALSSAAGFINRFLLEFARENPDIKVEVNLLDGAYMLGQIRENCYDVYFAHSSMVGDDCEKYMDIAVKNDDLMLYVNREIAGQMDGGVNWEKISRYPFIFMSKTDMTLTGKIMRICRKNGFVPKVSNVFNRAEMIASAVNDGLGVAILPSSIGEANFWPNLVELPLKEPDAALQVDCMWNPRRISPTGLKFLDIVRSMLNA